MSGQGNLPPLREAEILQWTPHLKGQLYRARCFHFLMIMY